MRNRARSFVLAIVFLTAVLSPRAAVLVSAQPACPAAPTDAEITAAIREAKLIVVGAVVAEGDVPNATDVRKIEFKPESFLKGSPTRAELAFVRGNMTPCASQSSHPGERYLVVVPPKDPDPILPYENWPVGGALYRLADGQAFIPPWQAKSSSSEAALIDRIRLQTNQLSQPADANEGAGIDWVSTILPVGGALVGLLIVGLLLMRIWHRIDPS